MKNIVIESINSTLRDPEGQEWLKGIYQKVSFEGGSGSYLPMTASETEEAIKTASWAVETVRPGQRPSAVMVAKGITGFYNMRSLENLPDDEKLIVGKFHGERPQLGWVSDEFAGEPTDELRAICGLDTNGNGSFLITVFPGPDIAPEAVEVPQEYLGKNITVAEAKRLGASFCKVVTSEAAKTVMSL